MHWFMERKVQAGSGKLAAGDSRVAGPSQGQCLWVSFILRQPLLRRALPSSSSSAALTVADKGSRVCLLMAPVASGVSVPESVTVAGEL